MTLSYKIIVPISLLCGMLTALCFPPCSFSWFAWIVLIPWFMILANTTTKQMLLAHGLFQATLYTIGTYWLSAVHPLSIIVVQIPLYFMCLPFPILFQHCCAEKQFLMDCHSILWTSQEYLRSFYYWFSLFIYGTFSSLPSNTYSNC